MAELGNIKYGLNLDDSDFNSKIEASLKKAREVNKEMGELLNFKIPSDLKKQIDEALKGNLKVEGVTINSADLQGELDKLGLKGRVTYTATGVQAMRKEIKEAINAQPFSVSLNPVLSSEARGKMTQGLTSKININGISFSGFNLQEELDKRGVKIKLTPTLSGINDVRETIRQALAAQKYKVEIEPDVKSKVVLKVDRRELIDDIRDTLKQNKFTVTVKTNATANRTATQQARIDALEALTEQRRARTLAIQQRMNSSTSQLVQHTRQHNTEVKKTESAYSRLQKMAAGFMGTFGAGMLLQSLIRIRGEFEQSYIALKAIVQSGERANEIFSQLQNLAVKSPFQFSQLASFTKMLSAYQIPTEELFDTTKRLADLSAGLGVDMGRIILAYGQVRAATVLKGTELRQFTEAGIPLVQMLADKYSELEGRVVSTADVFDRITKREVPFEDVKDVLGDLTNEGGRFYNMQEKLAETLKGKVSNLTDAYEIMMNKIGESNSGVLKGGVDLLTSMMSNYEALISILLNLGVAYGAYRTNVALTNAAQQQQIIELGESKAALLEQELAMKKLTANRLTLINKGPGGMVKEYTLSQQQLIETANQLTNADIRQLAYKGKISVQDAERLFLERKITEEQLRQVEIFDIMQRSKGYFNAKRAEYMYQGGMDEATATAKASQDTREWKRDQVALLDEVDRKTMRNTDNVGKLTRAWRKLGPAIGGALKSIASATVFMAAIGLVTDLIQAFMSMGEQIDEANKKMHDLATDNRDSIALFLKEYKALADELAKGSLGADQAERLYERAVDEIKKVAPNDYAKYLIDAEKLGTAQEKAAALLSTLNSIKDVADVMKKDDSMAEFAEGFWVISDGLRENLKDYQEIAKAQQEALLNPDKNGNVQVFDNYERAQEQLIEFAKNIESKIKELGITDPMGIKTYIDEAKKALIDGQDGIGEAATNLMNTVVDSTLINDGLIKKSTAAFEAWYNDLDTEQRKLVKNYTSNWSTSNEALLNAMFKQWTEQHQELFKDAQNLAQDISELKAFITVKLNIETPDPTTVQKILAQTATGAGELTDVNEWIAAHPTIVSATKDAANTADALKGVAQRKKELKDLIERNSKIAPDNKLQQRDLESWESALAEITEFEKIFGSLDQYDTTKSTGRGGGRNTEKDTVTEAIKQKFSKIEDAIKEYEKLAKEMSRIKALGELAKSEAYKFLFGEDGNLLAEFKDYFKDGGMLELIKATKALKGGKDKPKFDAELTKKQGAIEQENVLKRLSAAVSELTEKANIGAEQWKAYQDALSATGNTSLARAVAFRGGEAFDSLVQFQKNLLDKMLQLGGYDTNGKSGFAYMLGLDKESLGEMNSDIVKFFEDIKSAEKAELDEMDSLFLNVFENAMSTADKIAKIDYETAKKIKAINEQSGIGAGTKQLLTDRVNSEADFEKLQMSSDYINFFNSIYSLTQDKVKEIGDVVRDNLDKRLQAGTISAKDYYDEIEKISNQVKKFNSRKGNIATFLTGGVSGLFGKGIDGQQAKALAKAEEIRALEEEIAKARDNGDVVTEEALNVRLGAAKKEQKILLTNLFNSQQTLEKFTGTLSMVDQIVQSILASWQAIKDMGDALGHDTESGAWADVGLAMEMLDGLNSSIQSIAQGDVSGVVTLITSPITAIAKWHDNKLQKEIEKSQRMVTAIKAMMTDLERTMERQLGSRANGNNYIKQLGLMKQQLSELEKQKQAEEDKKKTDKDAVADYEEQIAELNDQVKHFAEDTLSELYDIDLKSWAKEIGDSLVDAFASGENAAKAWKDTVADAIKDVVAQFITLNMIEPAMENLSNYLFGSDGKSGVFGSDYELDENEIVGMGSYLQSIADAVPAAKNLYDQIYNGLKGYGIDMSGSSSSSSGLSASIKSITEDQADLLASYVNGIRADVAMIRSYYSQKMASEGGDVISTISVNVAQIAANTLRSANNTDEIKSLINSVIATTPNGKKLRV